MITVPNLKPGEVPFDPSILSITRVDADKGESDADPVDTLTHSLIKDAVTTLHQEDDLNYGKLQQYTAHELDDLLKDHAAFLQNQKTKFTNQFHTPTQKQLFIEMTEPYFTWSQTRVENLHRQKILAYQNEVIEKQNTEFLNRAVENPFDDATQTAYRNMILFNLENLLQHLPKKEKQSRLAQASQVFYKKIIEKRLELDPSRLAPLLRTPAVKQALTPQEIADYQQMADNATQTEQHKTLARQWLDDQLPQQEVTQRIKTMKLPAESARELREIYDHLKYNFNRERVVMRVCNLVNVWNQVLDEGGREENLPGWVMRVDVSLRDYLTTALRERRNKGGLPGSPDYAAILEMFAKNDEKGLMQELVDEGKFYSVITGLGGVGSVEFSLFLRYISGRLTAADDGYIKALHLARAHCQEENINEFLGRFVNIYRNKNGKEKDSLLDELEVMEILERMRPSVV